ncbi:MAG: hypothetical protein L0H93_16820, partial [Nocardioides sp.]|nr:hypothetical protein [Nocardioides sp.]
QRMRRDGRSPTILWLLLPVGSLSAGAGVLTAVTVLAFGLSRDRRRDLVLCAGVAAANAPWIVAGLLHAGNATADPVGAAVFALRGEGHLPEPLTAFGLGGIWNSEVVPVTREGALAVVSLVLVVVLLVAGQAAWRRTTPGRDQVAFLVCWGVGWGLAVAGWAAPDAAGWIGDHIPGGGLLRDGTRLLGLCALVLATVVAHGAVRVAGAIREREGRLLVTALLGVVPLSFMPDAGWGASGSLRPVDYPASYQTVREVLGDVGGADVLVLPFSSYRAPSWNNGHKVLDPVGRYLIPDFVVSDDLVVSDRTVDGEDPRGAEVRRALGAGGPREVSAELVDLGIGAVVVSRDAPGEFPRIAGEVVARTPELIARRLEDVTVTRVSPWWRIAMGGAWMLYLLPGILMGVLAGMRILRRRV